MIEIFFLSLADLTNPRILAILGRSLLITLAVFILLGVGLGWALSGTDPCGLFGDFSCALAPSAGGLGSVIITFLAIWFLFPAVALAVISAYIDRIAGIVEERHYPFAAAGAKPLGIWNGALLGLRSALRIIIYNLLALPFYILLLVTSVGPLILFIVVNGAAFGRDLGELVASRHGDRASRRAWLQSSRGGRMAIGATVTAIFLVPFANLLAPVLGAAMATHLYHRMQRNSFR